MECSLCSVDPAEQVRGSSPAHGGVVYCHVPDNALEQEGLPGDGPAAVAVDANGTYEWRGFTLTAPCSVNTGSDADSHVSRQKKAEELNALVEEAESARARWVTCQMERGLARSSCILPCRALQEAEESAAKLSGLRNAVLKELRAGGWGMQQRLESLVVNVGIACQCDLWFDSLLFAWTADGLYLPAVVCAEYIGGPKKEQHGKAGVWPSRLM